MLRPLRLALPRPGHLGAGGGAVRHRSVAADRSRGAGLRDGPDLASGHDRGRRPGEAARGGAADRARHDRKPPRTRHLLDGGQRRRAAADVGERPEQAPDAAGLGLRGAGRSRPARTSAQIKPLLEERARRRPARARDRRWRRARCCRSRRRAVGQGRLCVRGGGAPGPDQHRAPGRMFVPLYLWRAATFMARRSVRSRLDGAGTTGFALSDIPTAEAGARQQLVGRG